VIDRHDSWETCVEAFVEQMMEMFGERANECVWCGETVYMALQGLDWGGIWTTVDEDEGPGSPGINGPGTICGESPNREHSCFSLGADRWAV
jgi:hypothetical protein